MPCLRLLFYLLFPLFPFLPFVANIKSPISTSLLFARFILFLSPDKILALVPNPIVRLHSQPTYSLLAILLCRRSRRPCLCHFLFFSPLFIPCFSPCTFLFLPHLLASSHAAITTNVPLSESFSVCAYHDACKRARLPGTDPTWSSSLSLFVFSLSSAFKAFCLLLLLLPVLLSL